ncbi:MAG: transposase family protein [Desulfobacteraceae bacterium]|nr:transposase family protein [Desulfobacteraceae bacterium]
MKNKRNVKDEILALIKQLNAKFCITVIYIRCDNEGENLALEKACEQEGLGITFEYTAPNTPQQNGRVERKFATLYGRMRAMMRGSGLKGLIQRRLWAEDANTATDLSNISVKNKQSQSSFQFFLGRE